MDEIPRNIAARVLDKANASLARLEREMTIMKWPPEFQKIMWDAVAHCAALRAANSEEVKK